MTTWTKLTLWLADHYKILEKLITLTAWYHLLWSHKTYSWINTLSGRAQCAAVMTLLSSMIEAPHLWDQFSFLYNPRLPIQDQILSPLGPMLMPHSASKKFSNFFSCASLNIDCVHSELLDKLAKLFPPKGKQSRGKGRGLTTERSWVQTPDLTLHNLFFNQKEIMECSNLPGIVTFVLIPLMGGWTF